MRRRELVALLGGAAAWPLAARAQQLSPVRRLGVLATVGESDPEWKSEIRAFLDALKELGWTEAQNLHIEYRFGLGDPDRLRAAGKELVNARPHAILARSTPAVTALLAETRTIPIVFVSVSDPVGEKFAASLARPGGNVTGFTNVEASMSGKWLELLKETAPRLRLVTVLFNPTVAIGGGSYFLRAVEAAAPAFAVTLNTVAIHTTAEMEAAVTALAREPESALLVPPDPFVVAHRALLIELAARHRLPAVYAFRNMAVEGGLMSYGVDIVDLYRRSAAYVDRILKGTSAGELPIQAPTRFDLVINLKTAKALGLTIPPTLLARADEVIE